MSETEEPTCEAFGDCFKPCPLGLENLHTCRWSDRCTEMSGEMYDAYLCEMTSYEEYE